MVVQVAARWHLTVRDYCDRYSYPELRLHFAAFTKEAMAPLAPILTALEGSGVDRGDNAGTTDGGRTAPRQPRQRGRVKGMPKWWRPKPGVALTYVPHDAGMGYMTALDAQFSLHRLAPPPGVLPPS